MHILLHFQNVSKEKIMWQYTLKKNIAIKEIFVRTGVMAQYEKNTYPFQKT